MFHFLKRFLTFSRHFILSLFKMSFRLFSSLKASSIFLFLWHFSIFLKKSSIFMLSSASHARFVEVTVGGMMQVDVVSVHSWVSCSLSSKAIGGISTSGSLLVSALLVWQCLMRSATLTSILVISSNGLSWTVFLIPCLISWISTLSVLAIRSAKTLEMIAFSVLVKDRFVEASSLARSHC